MSKNRLFVIFDRIFDTTFNVIFYIMFLFILHHVNNTKNIYALSLGYKKLQYNINVKIDDPKLQSKINDIILNNESIEKILNNKQDYQKKENLYNIKNKINNIIVSVIRSKGYYDYKISQKFDSKNYELIFNVTDLVQYKINKIDISLNENSIIDKEILHKHITNIRELISINQNDTAQSKEIISSEKNILNYINDNFCFYEARVYHEAILDHTNKMVNINFIIKVKRDTKYGNIKVINNKLVKDSYLNNLIKIKPGSCYKKDELNKENTKLINSDLFINSVLYSSKPYKNNEGEYVSDINFDVTERKMRSIKLGAHYTDSTKFGGVINLEHRNLFGRGEHLENKNIINNQEQSAHFKLTKPFFLNKDQSLEFDLLMQKNKGSSFIKKKTLSTSGTLKTEINENIKYSYGLKYSYSTVKENNNDINIYSLISLPLAISYDNRSNILDPTGGIYAKASTEIFHDLRRAKIFFFKNKIDLASYLKLLKNEKFILGAKLSLGQILSVGDSNLLPSIEKFYLGGNNSLRGYAYQLAGELTNDGKPIGGISFNLLSVEFRTKLSDKFGIVLFTDIGNSYNKNIPSFDNLLHSYGVGIRYYTDVVPISFDIAIPSKRRKINNKKESGFQIYFGIGQNF